MRKIIFWIDYNIILPIATKTGAGIEFMNFLKKMYPEQFKNELEYENGKTDKWTDIRCPSCNRTEWWLYDQNPENKEINSINVQCSKCKEKYNYDFGTQELGPYKKIW